MVLDPHRPPTETSHDGARACAAGLKRGAGYIRGASKPLVCVTRREFMANVPTAASRALEAGPRSFGPASSAQPCYIARSASRVVWAGLRASQR